MFVDEDYHKICMTTIIFDQPLASLIVYGKIKEVPDDYKELLLQEENVLVAASPRSYKVDPDVKDILNKYKITDTEDFPDLRFLPKMKFIGFARVEDGQIIYSEPMPEPVFMPSYLQVWEKVVNYAVNDYNIMQFLEDIKYMQEDDLQQLLKLRERLVAKKHKQLQDIDLRIAEKKKKISDIENKSIEPKNEITTQAEVSEAQEEKSNFKWWYIILLAIAFGLLCWLVDKISFAVCVIIFLVAQVFIWMTGGKGGLKL